MAATTMRALVCRKLGDLMLPLSKTSPIYVGEWHPKPKILSPTSVLVKIVASSVNLTTGLQVEGRYKERPMLPYVLRGGFLWHCVGGGRKGDESESMDAVCGAAEDGAYVEELLVEASRV